eukprot:jgi/Botrbrau1/14464/Bobra.0014s0103.2
MPHIEPEAKVPIMPHIGPEAKVPIMPHIGPEAKVPIMPHIGLEAKVPIMPHIGPKAKGTDNILYKATASSISLPSEPTNLCFARAQKFVGRALYGQNNLSIAQRRALGRTCLTLCTT